MLVYIGLQHLTPAFRGFSFKYRKTVSCRSLGHREPLSSMGLAVLPKLVGLKADVGCRGDATLGLLDTE